MPIFACPLPDCVRMGRTTGDDQSPFLVCFKERDSVVIIKNAASNTYFLGRKQRTAPDLIRSFNWNIVAKISSSKSDSDSSWYAKKWIGRKKQITSISSKEMLRAVNRAIVYNFTFIIFSPTYLSTITDARG